jgi:activator of 2-hydroxyglutaryl-CoA dehydratase
LLLIDAGTSYFKIYNIKTKKYAIHSILEANKIKNKEVVLATGHNKHIFKNAKKINELVCLSKGLDININNFNNFIKNKNNNNNKNNNINNNNNNNFIIIDVGSRDIKLLEYTNNKFIKCDWNSTCGAMIGFTVELMCKYFKVDINQLKKTDKILDITCGLLGITNFFDLISKNNKNINEAISALIKGMAKYTYNFSNNKGVFYLSGGLCENTLFIEYLKEYNKNIKPLGRFILLEGLKTYM